MNSPGPTSRSPLRSCMRRRPSTTRKSSSSRLPCDQSSRRPARRTYVKICVFHLETLNILEGFDVAGWGHNSVEYLHHLIEAIKLASADRLAHAYSADVPIRGLVSKAYAASQRARIVPARAAVSEGERFNAAGLPGQI